MVRVVLLEQTAQVARQEPMVRLAQVALMAQVARQVQVAQMAQVARQEPMVHLAQVAQVAQVALPAQAVQAEQVAHLVQAVMKVTLQLGNILQMMILA
jgi:hypothetical protein